MINENEYINKWSEKLSLSVETIKKDFQKLLDEEKNIHKDLTEDEQKVRALQRLAMIFKKQLRSPAVGFEGMVIAIGDVVDTVSRVRKDAMALFKLNPQKAIQEGITNEDGEPLDTRKQWNDGRPNNGFGKPLPEHNWLRNIFGIAMKTSIEGDKPKLFSMVVSGENALREDIDMFKPVRFRAIDKTPPEVVDKSYVLNASTFTKFELDEDLKLPPFKELVNNYCKDLLVGISDLPQYHERMKNDYNRLAIVEGDVSTLVLEPTSVGSRRLILEDENKSLEDLETQGTTCWVPMRIPIDFAEQSKVLVVGRTGQGKKLGEDGNLSDEPGDIMINVYGLYTIPEYKIQPNVKELTVENSEISEEETPEKKNW